jgi:dipeptidyl aminopeptidase/acylaminoacyl peptidase
MSVPDGKIEYLPTPEWADVTCPDWSPDGRSVAYSCEDRRWKPERGEGTDWTSFRWFLRPHDCEEDEVAAEMGKDIRPASIWVTDLESGESRRLTKTAETDVVDLLPRWSPGGTQIAYARWAWGHEVGDMHYWWLHLRVVQANGVADRAITAPIYPPEYGWGATRISAAEGDFEWLPDGRRMVYREGQEGAEGRATGLMMVRVDGSQAWPLTPGICGWPKISLQSQTGYKYISGLLTGSFALCPDGEYAVASGGIGESSGIWKVPIPAEVETKN